MQAHIVWVTKYRYQVLKGEIQKRCKDLIVQICDAEDIRILKGVVSKDHIHMHIEYPPNKSISDIVKTKRKNIKKTPDGVQRTFQKILGQTLLGDRIRCLEYGECNTRYGG